MRRITGFTLIELMITIVVFTILVSAGIPALSNMVRDNRVLAQTNDLVAALNLARAEAIKRGGRVQVAVAQQEGGWSATVSITGALVDPLRVVDRTGSTITVNAATVIFTPTGTPVGTATFNLQPQADCYGTQRRQVAVTASGQITTTRVGCA